MKGSRKYPDDDGNLWLSAGEYGIDPRNGHWMASTPNGHLGDLSEHEVTEHEDGTITVRPSILVSDQHGILWHGFLERGVWREC